MGTPPSPSVAARVACGPRSPLYYRNGHSFRMKHGFPSRYHHPTIYGSGYGCPRIMDPHAKEFVPRKAWQPTTANGNLKIPTEFNQLSGSSDDKDKGLSSENEKVALKTSLEGVDDNADKSRNNLPKSELARQILLNFIIKSVQQNLDPKGKTTVNEMNSEVLENNTSEFVAKVSAIIKIVHGDGSNMEMNDCEQPTTKDVNKNISGNGEGFITVTKRRRNRHQLPNGVNGLCTRQSICTSVR